MKTLIAGVIAGLLIPFTFASPAAANGDCLNESEWDRIDDGMLKSVVHDIIGTDGFVTAVPFTAEGPGWPDYRYTWRGYPRCNGDGISQVGYRDYVGGEVNWRVFGKAR